ncbi:MAG: hypothetical protein GC206_08280 [Alphaproteobacteria bacterium]|nr:hypothetical protein [Alphaproteobacteria bacterium]
MGRWNAVHDQPHDRLPRPVEMDAALCRGAHHFRRRVFTTAEGMLAKHTGTGEFDAPDRAVALVGARDYGRYASRDLGTLPVDFLSTVDITNGNSGSATLNARGEFVGLAFDGTLDGVISDWWYEAPINRTIHVDSRYMLWVMDRVDGAQRLLTEMDVPRDDARASVE